MTNEKSKPAAAPKADKKAVSAYVCLTRIDHAGARYEAGDTIELNGAQAAPLLDLKAIEAA